MPIGKKTGGRQKGTPNKASVERQLRVAEAGVAPLAGCTSRQECDSVHAIGSFLLRKPMRGKDNRSEILFSYIRSGRQKGPFHGNSRKRTILLKDIPRPDETGPVSEPGDIPDLRH
jgi:hypothetical protein